jgi:hypothetical protein
MSQPTAEALNTARSTAGSAEYLSTLLRSANNTKCSHFPKIKPGAISKIPHCLAFFAVTGSNISWLRTDRVCLKCYKLAVPDGFTIWSTGCIGEQTGAPLPQCVQAGNEHFGGDESVAVALRSPMPEHCIPLGSASKRAFEWVQEQKQPVFIDFLHLSRPFNGAAVDAVAEKARVDLEVKIAFDNATRCVVTHGVDYNERLLAAGPRLVEVPPRLSVNISKVCNLHRNYASCD